MNNMPQLVVDLAALLDILIEKRVTLNHPALMKYCHTYIRAKVQFLIIDTSYTSSYENLK